MRFAGVKSRQESAMLVSVPSRSAGAIGNLLIDIGDVRIILKDGNAVAATMTGHVLLQRARAKTLFSSEV
jgi:hypothetical protein